MTPRDDERRKFEAWVRSTGIALHLARENDAYMDRDTWKAWHSWMARAEQAETPLNGPSCTVCGTAMEFKCPSCGSTPAPTEPSQTRHGVYFTEQGLSICREIVRKEMARNPEGLKAAFEALGFEVPSATASVEDRPAPTLPKTVGHDYNCACDECLAPTPPETPRATALEEAAKIAESWNCAEFGFGKRIADAIRGAAAAPVEDRPAATVCGQVFIDQHGQKAHCYRTDVHGDGLHIGARTPEKE